MKKILTYFAIVIALVSCNGLSPMEDEQDIHFDLGIAIAGGSGTKNTVTQDPNGSPGEGDMGENYIKTVDIFFYKEATQNANPNATPTYHLYKANANVNERWTMSDAVTDALLKQIFDSEELTSGLKCTAYAVVNYSPASGSSFADNATRAQIRQSVKASTFNTVDANADGIPQECFVMEGETELQLSIQNGRKYASATIPVYRAASKIRLEVTVPDDIVTNGVPDGNGFNWKPLPDQMSTVLVHGVRKGIVCAKDDDYTYDFAGSDNYFAEASDANLWSTYGHRLVETGVKHKVISGVDTEIGKKYEHVTPMYSYPTLDWKNTPANETYLTLILPWQREDMVNEFKNTYYQIPIAVNPTDPEYRLKHNRYYRMEVEVGILGSFELEDKVQLYPSTYIILDWSVKKEDQTSTTSPVSMSQTAYLAVASHAETLDNENSRDVGYASSHDVTVTVEKIEYLDYSQKQIRLARITPDQPNLIYYYTDFTDDGNGSYTVSGTGTPEIVNGIYASYSATATVDTETDATNVTFSHTIDPDEMFTSVKVFVNISNGVVEDEKIVFTQNPPIRIESHLSNGVAFVNRYQNNTQTDNIYTSASDWIGCLNESSSAASLTATGTNTNPNVYSIKISSFSPSQDYILGDPRVSSPDNNLGHTDASWSADITITFTKPSSGTYETQTGTYYYTYSQYLHRTGNQIQRQSNNRNSAYINLPSGDSWSNHTTEATAYGPDADNYYYWREYNDLGFYAYWGNYYRARYYSTATRYVVTNERALENYYPTNPTGTENMIAPELLIASSYGKTTYKISNNSAAEGNMTLDLAAMRCALYQEDGYPAGRWRLPTYAEVKFIMELSTANKIPTLFQMSTPSDSEGYWCANGRVILNNNVVQLQSPPGTAPTAPRCVYDLWYWGEEHSTYATTWHLGDND